MPRNPRRPSHDYAATIASVALICISVALALLAQVRLKDELNRLDRDVTRLDRQITEQKKLNQKLQADYQFLVSSAGLTHRVRDMQLSLVVPAEDARIVLPEPTLEPPVSVPGGTPVPAPGAGAATRRTYASDHNQPSTPAQLMARQRR